MHTYCRLQYRDTYLRSTEAGMLYKRKHSNSTFDRLSIWRSNLAFTNCAAQGWGGGCTPRVWELAPHFERWAHGLACCSHTRWCRGRGTSSSFSLSHQGALWPILATTAHRGFCDLRCSLAVAYAAARKALVNHAPVNRGRQHRTQGGKAESRRRWQDPDRASRRC